MCGSRCIGTDKLMLCCDFRFRITDRVTVCFEFGVQELIDCRCAGTICVEELIY